MYRFLKKIILEDIYIYTFQSHYSIVILESHIIRKIASKSFISSFSIIIKSHNNWDHFMWTQC